MEEEEERGRKMEEEMEEGGGGGKTEKIVNECSRGTKTGGGPRKDIVTYSVLLVCIKKKFKKTNR